MITKEQLKRIIIEQRDQINGKDTGVPRTILATIEDKLDLPHIIVITGIRRCGKSTLLKQIMNKYYPDGNYYYLNFEDERLRGFQASDFNEIYETLLEVFGKTETFFIDEIQNVEGFETFVRRFYDEGHKFIVTGSNAGLLGHELGTRLTGRHQDVRLRPFSFEEFLLYNKVPHTSEDLYRTGSIVNIKKHFVLHLENGGMPEYVKYNDLDILSGIYEDIVLKDIVVRYGVNHVKALRDLYRFLVTNTSNRFSYNSLMNITGLGSVNTIKDYISHL